MASIAFILVVSVVSILAVSTVSANKDKPKIQLPTQTPSTLFIETISQIPSQMMVAKKPSNKALTKTVPFLTDCNHESSRKTIWMSNVNN
jgi:hypothetical protein